MRFAASRLGKNVYDVEDVTVRFGERTLLDDVTWRLGPGDRIGLLGPERCRQDDGAAAVDR